VGRRHLARELALKVLFELETDGGDAERSLQYHVAESRADAEVADFARTLIQGVRDHQTEIDAQLKEASSNWGLDQMAKVERTLLRIASFEILYLPSVPLKAAINESIELAKTFGGDEAGRFVNGVLGRIVLHVPRAEEGVGADAGLATEDGSVAVDGSDADQGPRAEVEPA